MASEQTFFQGLRGGICIRPSDVHGNEGKATLKKNHLFFSRGLDNEAETGLEWVMMNEQVNLGELELLAKLMATENLSVTHRQVQTAYFDVKTRELVLPMWKNLTRPIYHLMVSHEIGHALFTPSDEWFDMATDEPHLKNFVNVVEDARIERLVKNLYPGSRRDFFTGYTQLRERGFFGTENKSFDAFSFIDRINLHYKLGFLANVPFSAEERVFLSMIDAADDFDQVVEVARAIYEFSKTKQSLKRSPDQAPEDDEGESSESGSGFGEATEESGNGEEGSEGETEEGSEGDTEEGSEGETEGNSQNGPASAADSHSRQKPPQSGQTSMVDELASETISAMEKFMSNMIDINAMTKRDIHVVFPEDASPWIIPHNEILSKISTDANGDALYAQSRVNLAPAIETLTREFQTRKAAEGYSRSKLAKTGKIDPKKLASYTLTEDIFMRNLVTKDSKNHGVVVFVDFSGSMSSNLTRTFDQLQILVSFCRKSAIPHRVYAFVSRDRLPEGFVAPGAEAMPIKNEAFFQICIEKTFHLLELFNDGMKPAEVAKMFSCLYSVSVRMNYDHPYFVLGDTPLAQTMLLADPILKNFQRSSRAEVVSAVFLTDGDDSGIACQSKTTRLSLGGGSYTHYGYKYIARGRSRDSSHGSLCDFLLNNLRSQKFRTIGVRISDDYDLKGLLRQREISSVADFKQKRYYEKSNYKGYDLFTNMYFPRYTHSISNSSYVQTGDAVNAKGLIKELRTNSRAKNVQKTLALGFAKVISGEQKQSLT